MPSKLFLLSLLILNFCPLLAQDTIPQNSRTDSTEIDTIVIRKVQDKIRHTPRGVNLTNPIISFKKTKPLSKEFNRFRIPSFWTNVNQLGINLSEVAFVNWNAGGDNSATALGNLRFDRNYKFRYIQWDNYMEFRYGLNAQEGRKLRKTDDAFRLSSTFGFRRDTVSNWYYSARANFNTQFSNGYKYPDRSAPISRFMAPGYAYLGAGTSYITPNQKFNLYISPVTQKTTFVLDQNLADKGAFGVQKAKFDADGNLIQPGENIFLEFGFLITNTLETEVYKNIGLKHRISFYTDYLRRFGNIDVDWELNIVLKVNRYIVTTIGTQIIYDDDILFNQVVDAEGQIIDPGEPKIQFKQLLGVGIAYDF